MHTAAWVVLGVAAAFAAGDWVSRVRGSRPLEYLCKPAALAALLGVAVLVDPTIPGRRWWFVAALGWSLVGDVLLMLPSDRFVAGLAAFLVAHLCYVAGFRVDGAGASALAVSAVVVAVVVVPVGGRILAALRAGPHRSLAGPVAGYVLVISAMLVSALATGNVAAGVGAALFVGSDSLIAWDRFVRPVRGASVAIMVTYHLGQAALVLSLLR